MDNHVMYYLDGDVVLELRRCFFCRNASCEKQKTVCLRNLLTSQDACAFYEAAGSEVTSERIAKAKQWDNGWHTSQKGEEVDTG